MRALSFVISLSFHVDNGYRTTLVVCGWSIEKHPWAGTGLLSTSDIVGTFHHGRDHFQQSSSSPRISLAPRRPNRISVPHIKQPNPLLSVRTLCLSGTLFSGITWRLRTDISSRLSLSQGRQSGKYKRASERASKRAQAL